MIDNDFGIEKRMRLRDSNRGAGLREEPFHSSMVIQGKTKYRALKLVDELAGGCEILFRASSVAWMKIQNS